MIAQLTAGRVDATVRRHLAVIDVAALDIWCRASSAPVAVATATYTGQKC